MVHESAAAGYHKHAKTYANVRPSYHPDLIERFASAFGDGVVVELGAGTGIFTGQMLAAGITPIAIEPVREMRDTLRSAHPDVETIDATAEATGLAESSVDTVVVAQAFHWFDHTPAMAEIRRILRPGGYLVCVWNVRDESVPWVGASTEIVDRYAGDTPRYRTMRWRRAIEADPAFRLTDEFAVDNPRPADGDAVAARALSTSFIAALDPDRQAAVLEELRGVTDPLGSSFDFPYRSELQAWIYDPARSAD